MIKWGIRVLIIHYLEQGLPQSTIAERLGIDRRTIHRWITTGQLEREVDTGVLPRPERRRSQAAKLAPYHSMVETRLKDFPELSAVRLFGEIRAAGYTGGYTQLKELVRRSRTQPTPDRPWRPSAPSAPRSRESRRRRSGRRFG